MATLIQQRRGTAAEWAAVNPILKAGEIGFETDTGILKTGNGVDRWNVLKVPYLLGTGGIIKALSPELIALTLGSHELQTADIFRVVDVNGAVLSGINAKGQFFQTGLGKYTAKGDLLVGTAVDASAKLAVGSVGLVLTADPTQATGMKWSAASKAADVQIFTASGTWTKPANARMITVVAFGGGESGGAYTIAMTDNYATVQGGRGGVRIVADLLPAGLAATVPVTVGAGGASETSRYPIPYQNGQFLSKGKLVGGDSIFGPIRALGGGQVGTTNLISSSPTSYNGTIETPAVALSPGGGAGNNKGYSSPGTIFEGTSAMGTLRVSRSGSGLGGDGGFSQSAVGGDGGIPGAGGGAAIGQYTYQSDGDGNAVVTYDGRATAGAGGRGEVIIVTHF